MAISQYHQSLFLGPTLSERSHHYYGSRFHRLRFSTNYEHHAHNSHAHRHASLSLKFVPLASSSSLTGSSASEPLMDAKISQRRRKIAGIDQDELDPMLLADPDSCFFEFNGVHIHHKIYNAESDDSSQTQTHSHFPLMGTKKVGFPMILLHGFGASLFSWSRVTKPLAAVTGSKVLAFDRPAFGLTSRVNRSEYSAPGHKDMKALNPYSMAFSVLVTLKCFDVLGAEKAILVGHSLGALVAVNAYFEAPERVAGLILVSPAILAPRALNKAVQGNQLRRTGHIERDRSDSNSSSSPFLKLYQAFSKFIMYIAVGIISMVKGMTDMLKSLYKKALSAILRSAFAIMLIRMIIDKFGIAVIRNSWYDSEKVSEQVLHGYTKPLRAKGWDRALIEFTAAMLMDTEHETKPPLSKRLHQISCPVLIVTGDNDRLVPAWNAKRLSQVIPGSTIEVIKNCGHIPHEEKVEEFVSVVAKFLQTAFGGREEQYLQTVI